MSGSQTTLDECLLFLSCQPFDRAFPARGFGAGACGFLIHQLKRSAPPRVARAFARVVGLQTRFDIRADPCVKRAVSAAQD